MKTIEINGKQYQEYGVVMLPTENWSPLVHSTSRYGGLFKSEHYSPMKNMGDSYQHLYFVSDEEIKQGDWFIELDIKGTRDTYCKKPYLCDIGNTGGFILTKNNGNFPFPQNCKKVVAATDKSLHSACDGFCATNECVCISALIPQKFVEYFIEAYNTGNKISKVLVEVEIYYTSALLPSEKYKAYRIKLTKDNEVNVLIQQYPIGGYAPGHYMCKCVSCKKEFTGDKRATQCEPCAIEMVNINIKTNSIGGVEIETDEKAAENIYNEFPLRSESLNELAKENFIDGARHQAKEMYSKEEVENLLYKIDEDSGELLGKDFIKNWTSENLKK